MKKGKQAIAIVIATATVFTAAFPGRTPVSAADKYRLSTNPVNAVMSIASSITEESLPGIETALSEQLMTLLDSHDVSFINYGSGRALNDYHSKTNDGATIDTYPHDNTRSVMWQVQNTGSAVRLKSKHDPVKGVDVKSNGKHYAAEGQEVRLFTPSSKDCLSEWELKVDMSRSTTDQIVVSIASHDNPTLKIAHPGNDSDGSKRKCLILSASDSDTTRWILTSRDGKNLTVDDLMTSSAKCAEIRESLAKAIEELQSEVGSTGQACKSWLKDTYGKSVSAYCVAYYVYILSKANITLLNTSGSILTYVPSLRDEFRRVGALYNYDESQIKTGDALILNKGQHFAMAYRNPADGGSLWAFHGNWSQGKVHLTKVKNGKVNGTPITYYGSITEYLTGVKD